MIIINYISRQEIAVYAFYSTLNSYQCPRRVKKHRQLIEQSERYCLRNITYYI